MMTGSNYVDDQTWVAMVKTGNEIAFSQIVEKYQPSIYNLCYQMLGEPAEAEDAAQEVFLRAYLNVNSYDETRSKFSTWLFSIASHYCIDRLRARRLRWVSWDDVAAPHRFSAHDTYQPERALLEAETSQETRSLLNKLPEDYRAAVILKYWHSKSYQDIAQTLNTTVSGIKSKLFRARRMMAKAATQQQPVIAVGRLAQPC